MKSTEIASSPNKTQPLKYGRNLQIMAPGAFNLIQKNQNPVKNNNVTIHNLNNT